MRKESGVIKPGPYPNYVEFFKACLVVNTYNICMITTQRKRHVSLRALWLKRESEREWFFARTLRPLFSAHRALRVVKPLRERCALFPSAVKKQ